MTTHTSRRSGTVYLAPSVPRRSADMNVTPLIDVLLVLLVIFMAALPLTQRGADVDLPALNSGGVPPPVGQIVVELDAERRLALNQQQVSFDQLESRLRDVFATRQTKTLFVIGAPGLRYGEIVRVIDIARGAGVSRVGIVTQGMRRDSPGRR